MAEPTPDSPSDLVFDTARDVAADMHDGIDAMICDFEDYVVMLINMRNTLRKIRANMIKHSMPITQPRSIERRKVKAQINAITNAMDTARKLEKMLDLTTEDINEVMEPYKSDEETERIIIKIMGQ